MGSGYSSVDGDNNVDNKVDNGSKYRIGTIVGIIIILLLVGTGIAVIVISRRHNGSNCNLLIAPTGVALVSPVPGTISVSWNTVPSATSYKIYRSTLTSLSTSNYQEMKVSTTNSVIFNQLNTANQYFIVTAVNSCGESLPSGVVNLQMTCTLDQVTGITLTSVSSNGILASWNPVSNATSYSIYILLGNNDSIEDSVSSSNTTYSFTGTGDITIAVNAVNECAQGPIGFLSATFNGTPPS